MLILTIQDYFSMYMYSLNFKLDIYTDASLPLLQPCSLALTRSDYMVDGGAPTNSLTQDNGVYMAAAKIKQIEYNTIAVGLGGLCTRVVSYYR